jgi:hypothetical protein
LVNESTARSLLSAAVNEHLDLLEEIVIQNSRSEASLAAMSNWIIQQDLVALISYRLAGLQSCKPLNQILQPIAYRDVGANIVIAQQIAEIAACLKSAGIEPVVLKGIALAATVYPVPEWRNMSDIDLLLDRVHIPDAVRLLATLGYQEQDVPTWRRSVIELAYRHHPRLEASRPSRVGIELHWVLAPASRSWIATDVNWFRDQTMPVSYVGTTFLGLRPVANLLYLAMHLTVEHGLNCAVLKWLVDIHFLVTAVKTTADFWEEVILSAKRIGWSAAVFEALSAAHYWLDTPVPNSVLTALSSDSEPRLIRLVRARSKPNPSRAYNRLLHIMSLDNRMRLKTIVSIILPTPTFMRWRYRLKPAWLWPMSYLYRWLYMSWHGAKALGAWLRQQAGNASRYPLDTRRKR